MALSVFGFILNDGSFDFDDESFDFSALMYGFFVSVFIEFYSRNDKHIPALYVAAKTSRCFIYLVLNFWRLTILVSSSFGSTLSFSQHFFARFICLCRVLLL